MCHSSIDLPRTFTCQRCRYTTRFKSNLAQHLRNDTVCCPLMVDPTRESLLQQLYAPRVHIESKCEHCHIVFSSKQSLEYHLIHRVCQTVDPHAIANANTVPISQNTYNNNSNNTINIHIHLPPNHGILDFGREYIEHITDTMKKEYITGSGGLLEGMIKLVKDVHFNSDVPQNRNIYHTASLKIKWDTLFC